MSTEQDITTSAGRAVAPTARASILARVAERYSVEPARLLDTLKATAFRGNVSNEQMMALLIVADQYKLNPFTREIYAFPDKSSGVVPVVGVDGWARIINEHPAFDGMEFSGDDDSVTCTIYRKDRSHPITVTEYMSECRRSTPPWQSHPRRMLRHKAMIQCARLAFGFAGIYDPDEAERIAAAADAPPEPVGIVPPSQHGRGASQRLRAAVLGKQRAQQQPTHTATQIDADTGEIVAAPQEPPEPQAAADSAPLTREQQTFADALGDD